MGKLTKAEEVALRMIGEETRPCQCQFSPHELSRLGAYGFIAITTCNMSHGSITLTPAGRAALSQQGGQ
jgi:hypothetical protein